MITSDISPLNTEEAEQALLGCILLYPAVWHTIATLVRPEHFYNPVHGRIFSRIASCVEQGKTPDAMTLKPYFQNDDDLAHVGGGAYLVHLVSNVVTIHNASAYADTIAAMSARRRLIATAQDAIERAADPNEDFFPLLSDLNAEVAQLAASGANLLTQSDLSRIVIENLHLGNRCDPTGIRVLDERAMRGGLYSGKTYAFAAGAKAGKTTLSHSISYNLNQTGIRHAYIALEMGGEQITQRQIARMGRFNSLQFMENRTAEFADHAARSASALPNNCLYVYRPNITFSELKIELAQAVMKENINGYFLDYWQLVGGKEKGQSQEEHQANVAQWLAGFNAKHKVWGVIVCQLNKEDNAFGGAGINRACDQFYKLFRSQISGCENQAWLELEHSRYTFAGSFGDETIPSLEQVTTAGPYFRDFGSDDR